MQLNCKLGASQVICTDGDVLSVEIAKENIHSNFDKISESELAIKALKLYWYRNVYFQKNTHIYNLLILQS